MQATVTHYCFTPRGVVIKSSSRKFNGNNNRFRCLHSGLHSSLIIKRKQFFSRNKPWTTARTSRCFFTHLQAFLPKGPQNSVVAVDGDGYALYSTASRDEDDGTRKKPVVEKQKENMDAANSAADAAEKVPNMKIIATLGKYLWMKDNYEFQIRVVAALCLLVGAKVLNVQLPFLFKLAIDWLAATKGNTTALAEFAALNPTALAVFWSPAAVLVGYGIARAGAAAFNELRTAIFSKVALRTIHSVSLGPLSVEIEFLLVMPDPASQDKEGMEAAFSF